MWKKTALFLFFGVGLLKTVSGFADAAFDYGYSEITRGMGGAGSALPQDTLIAAINPAGMAFVKHKADVGAVIYFPSMYYDASTVQPNGVSQIIMSPGRHISNISFFFLPDFGLLLKSTKKSTLGISFYSLGGYGSSYPGWGTTQLTVPAGRGFVVTNHTGPFGGGYLATDLKQAVGSLTYAVKFLQNSSVGVSVLLGIQSFDGHGSSLLSAFSNAPSSMTDEHTDVSVGIGARVGVLLGLNKFVKLAASYQPKVLMSKFEKYKGLFPNHGEFDYPANGLLGLAINVKNKLHLAFDVQKIWFSEIPAYATSNKALIPPDGQCSVAGSRGPTCFGGKNGIGFGWKDSLGYKVGVQYQLTRALAVRAGYSHNTSVLTTDHTAENVIIPGAVIQDFYTAGASLRVGKTGQLNGLVVYIPLQKYSGDNSFSLTADQKVSIHAKGFGFGASYSWLMT